jgi:L-2-hydroxycarboxylate dehydrogenase (NAD+)
MRIGLEELERLAKRAVLTFGYSDTEASMILDVLMYAQLRGNNQGIVKLIGPGIPKDPAAAPISIQKETPVSALVDGGNNHAMVVVSHAVEMALGKARAHGIGLVGVNHLSTSSGAIGCYARRIAGENMIGIVFAGSSPVVAAEGSFEPMFGTNPLAIAVPSESDPVVLDMATAAMAFYGVIEAKTAGRDLPPDVALDEDGQPTIDPAEALKGALRTFDRGVKGSGLSFMVQALTGPLIGASFVGIGDVAGNWGGHLIIALDPELFGGVAALREGVGAMARKVKAAKRLPGVNEILLPGERGDRQAKSAQRQGHIEIEDNLYRELRKVAERAEE